MTQGDTTQRIPMFSRCHAGNPKALLKACLPRLGTALLPDHLRHAALAEGGLRVILPDRVPQTRFGNEITARFPSEDFCLEPHRVLLDDLQSAQKEHVRIVQDAKFRKAVKD
jgi:DNA-binding transcriptional LysR family regulator